jgi:hypothetical protein
MGNYLVQTGGLTPAGDLTDAFGNALLAQLCSNGVGGVDVAFTEWAIKRSEAMINTDLGPFYTIPFAAPVNEEIKTIALMLAEFFMYARKPEFRRQDGTNPAGDSFKAAGIMLKSLRTLRPPLQAGSKETPAVVGSLVDSDEQRDPIT